MWAEYVQKSARYLNCFLILYDRMYIFVKIFLLHCPDSYLTGPRVELALRDMKARFCIHGLTPFIFRVSEGSMGCFFLL